jgi:hypothetical protein
MSLEGFPATEASGRAIEGRPILIKLLLEGQYLHQTMKPDHQPTWFIQKSSTELRITGKFSGR